MFGRDASDRGSGNGEEDFETARNHMVDRLVDAGRLERRATIDALRAVPRHEFVPESRHHEAYADRPLPIGSGQTISAPHMVGLMCDILAADSGDAILEIGTGCGYHAAVTAEIVGPENVHTVEYVESLAETARERFERLGYSEIHVRTGNGWNGWPEHAPYDGAYLTCGAPELPERVVEQLRSGGRIVAPIGTTRQTLLEAVRTESGLDRRTHGGVRFVPMQGGDS